MAGRNEIYKKIAQKHTREVVLQGNNMMKRWNIIFKTILVIALMAYIIKNLFVGMDVDEGYGLIVGYRLAKGDKLLLEMWEPHQLSAIFTGLFIKIWLLISGGSAEFLDLYLKFTYFLIHGMIAFFVYRTIKKCILGMNENTAALIACIFFVTSPKCIFIPEYSNLHIWFFILLCMAYVRYYSGTNGEKRKSIWLILAGIFLTGDVLAYPSMIILLPLCMLVIYLKSDRSFIREMILFISPCIISFTIFLIYLLSYIKCNQLPKLISLVLADGAHQQSYIAKIGIVGSEFFKVSLVIIICSIFAYVLIKSPIFKHNLELKNISRLEEWLIVFMCLQFLIQIYEFFTSNFNGNYPQIVYIALSILGVFYYYRNNKIEKNGFFMIVTSFVSYLGVIYLSNWGPLCLNTYMVGGTIGGIICIYRYYSDCCDNIGCRLVAFICGVMVLVNCFGYCYLVLEGEQGRNPIYTMGGYGHGGIKAGIISSWMSAHRYNTNLEVWSEAVPEGSCVLYVGQSQFLYALNDCTIATPNTISTPIYDEKLFEYWKINPKRYPNVVVFESWYGDIPHYGEESFIMKWVKNDFGYSRVEEYPYITVFYK